MATRKKTRAVGSETSASGFDSRTVHKKRSECCKKGWRTRRRKARARSLAAKLGWKTRRKKQRKLEKKRERERPARADRAKAGHARREARVVAGPGFIPIVPQVYPKAIEPTVEVVVRAPETITEEQLEAMIEDFARRRLHPDLWARGIADMYDLDVAPLYKAYFEALYRPATYRQPTRSFA